MTQDQLINRRDQILLEINVLKTELKEVNKQIIKPKREPEYVYTTGKVVSVSRRPDRCFYIDSPDVCRRTSYGLSSIKTKWNKSNLPKVGDTVRLRAINLKNPKMRVFNKWFIVEVLKDF